jgi:hypothetical protein
MNQWNPKTLQIKCNQSSATNEFRFYNTSAIPGKITQVVITFSALTVIDASKLMFLGGTSEVSATTGGTAGTWNSTTKTLTWTPSSSDNFTYFAFYQNGKAASGTNYLASSDAIVVTYSTGGGDTPSISADNVEIEYNATSGSIVYEIENYVEGTMAATTTADWISDFNYDQADEIGEVGFTTTTNPSATIRTATVTLTYTYGGSEPATKNVTVTQAANPNVIPTIAEVRTQTTGSTVVTKGVVTSRVDNTAYIQDATAAICVYGNNNNLITSLNLGDEIRVSGTLSNYNNLLEITNPTYTVLSTGNTVTPEVMTIANILTSTNQGWFVKIEGATVGATSSGNTTLTQDGSSIVARNLSGVTEGDVINLTGNIGRYNQNNQIANPAVIYSPSVSINPATADPFTYIYSQGPSEEQLFEVTGAHLTSTDITVTVTAGSEYFEITDDAVYGNTVTIASGDAVSVRLKAGLAVNANYAGTLTIATQGAQDVTIALTGSVTNQVYTLTDLSDSDKGSITFSPGTSVEASTNVTITPVANDAYVFNGTLTFYDEDLEEIETINNVSGSYNYTMPAYNVGVEAGFDAKPTYAVTCEYDEELGIALLRLSSPKQQTALLQTLPLLPVATTTPSTCLAMLLLLRPLLRKLPR